MITFSNAKINLGLSIIARRPDGYHDLETVFYPVAWEDALEVHADEANDSGCRLHLHGMKIEGSPEDNLVMKAYRLLASEHRCPAVEAHLYKHIPSGAGLGGGSSDAAFMLKLLNERFDLRLSVEILEAYASRLGADCAFFIRNTPTFAEGTGNLFSPVSLSLKDYQIVIVKPDVFVSTREAFAHVRPRRPAHSVREVIGMDVELWKDYLQNDFEQSVFAQYPIIADIKEELYRMGAFYASMSGSGSAVFGLFKPEDDIPPLAFDASMSCHVGQLQ